MNRHRLLPLLLAATLLGVVGCPKSPVGRISIDGTLEPDVVGPWDSRDANGGFALCEPCVADSTCQEGLCVALPEGSFCLEPCTFGYCPEGFSCGETETGEFCLPPSGTCSCSPEQSGEQAACAKENEHGQCLGLATCDPAVGWVCGAPAPAAEICDYEDNDCDGDVDEDFLLGEWYFGSENCGDCGISCDDEIEHGQGYCSMAPPPPSCKVSACDPGYHTVDGLTCELLIGSACIECETDEECTGGRCIQMEGGRFCLPDCGENGLCPDTFTCVEEEGSCFPETGSCICTPETAGQVVRSCMNVNEFGSCTGFQACGPDGWLPCDAQVAVPEDCNGFDDNCNGVIDEDLSGVEPCVNGIPGVGSCPGFLICEGELGYTCNAPAPEPEVCDYEDNNCDKKVDEGFKDPETGLYLTDAHCASCNNDCGVLAAPHAVYHCLLEGSVPGCGMVCEEGWVDLNEEEVDGCECEFLSADDPPDGIDQNCDGIDGDPANAVFVAPWGKETNPGTPEEPVKSVSMGVQRSQEKNKGHVYVANGFYKENIVLADGKQLFGGFATDFSVRDLALYTSAIEADPTLSPAVPQATVRASGIGKTKSSFEGFTVTGPYVTDTGRSSYVLYLKDCGPNLTVRDNVILAGDAGDGENGDDGDDGGDGLPGTTGKPAFDVGMGPCGNASSTGGAGGELTCGGTNVSGGKGGMALCPDYNEFAPPSACPVEESQNPVNLEFGSTGLPSGKGGMGGDPGRDATQTNLYDGKVCGPDFINCSYCHLSLWGTDGMAGQSGKAGQTGIAGVGCKNVQGQVVNGEWQSITGGPGGGGSAGSGGGGGGAGGGIETHQCGQVMGGHDLGGSGGGGGSGGCAGAGGTAGTGGGGAFGIFLFWTASPEGRPTLANNQVDTGFGGAGGKGGKGGVGGTGGWGGAGGKDGAGQEMLWCAGEGGEGGHGGNGGSGGGGGGGCGGAAYGIWVALDGTPGAYLTSVKTANPVNLAGAPGTGGSGGPSKGQPGQPGQAGPHAAFNF
jgi:hypothetical protein